MPTPATFPEIGAYIAKGNPALGIVPSWMVNALAEIGTAEIHGAKHNPRIVKYWEAAGPAMKAITKSDETSWCAAFVGALLRAIGLPGAGPNAKSFLNYGVKLDGPVFGAIVVLNRPPVEWQGHVGFFAGATDKRIHLLGGNQGDRVSIASFDRGRVAGIRWPTGVPLIGTNITLPVSAADPTTS